MTGKKLFLFVRLTALTLLIVTLSSVLSVGQTLTGRIIDGIKGDTLSFVTVSLVNLNSPKIINEQVTNLQGDFIFEKIIAGNYALKISAIGYDDTTFTNIIINSDTTVILDLHKPCKYDEPIKNNICPACNSKNKVIPIRYGLIIGADNTKDYFPGGCEVGYCYPHWYCKRDKLQF